MNQLPAPPVHSTNLYTLCQSVELSCIPTTPLPCPLSHSLDLGCSVCTLSHPTIPPLYPNYLIPPHYHTQLTYLTTLTYPYTYLFTISPHNHYSTYYSTSYHYPSISQPITIPPNCRIPPYYTPYLPSPPHYPTIALYLILPFLYIPPHYLVVYVSK